jgi:hypothetical protein
MKKVTNANIFVANLSDFRKKVKFASKKEKIRIIFDRVWRPLKEGPPLTAFLTSKECGTDEIRTNYHIDIDPYWGNIEAITLFLYDTIVAGHNALEVLHEILDQRVASVEWKNNLDQKPDHEIWICGRDAYDLHLLITSSTEPIGEIIRNLDGFRDATADEVAILTK